MNMNMNHVRKHVQCPYCQSQAHVLTGELGRPRWQGWTRYECRSVHRFAVPTHSVEVQNPTKQAAMQPTAFAESIRAMITAHIKAENDEIRKKAH